MKRLFIFLLFIYVNGQSQIVPFSFVKRPAPVNLNTIVPDGLTLYLDANVSSSYNSNHPNIWNDLSSSGGYADLYNTSYSNLGGGSIAFSGGAYGDVINSSLNNTAYTKQVWVYINYAADNNILSGDFGSLHYLYPYGTNNYTSGHTFPPSVYSASPISYNVWKNIVVTFDSGSGGWNLYIDGVLDASNTTDTNPLSGVGKMYLGAFGGGYNLEGYIGQVLVYNRALTAAEVVRNFNVTKTRFGF